MSAMGEPDETGRFLPGQGGDARREAALRALLERAVPRLPAPAQRMGRVRQLVVRRRRRRMAGAVGAAGVAGGVVAGVTLAVLGQGPVAGPGDSGAMHQVPAASPTAVGSAFRYPGLDGLTVRLPDGWSGLVVRGAGDLGPVGLAGNRPEAVGEDRCTDLRRYCLVPGGLRRGEGVMVLRPGRTESPEKIGQGARLADTPPGDSCRRAGGTRELVGRRAAGESRPHELIAVSVCLNRPSADTLEQVRSIFGSAALTDPSATP
ncbi:hypothetical protein [Streptomyces sp. NPDC020480]|uniref:hypothetical protein n=1 Tax=Streptomyces sp. NPDC020480 TaxID=3365076 RepID=UPI003794D221